MEIDYPSRLILVSRDQDGEIVDCFMGPYSQGRLQDALAIAYVLLNAGWSRLVRVEIHPAEHINTYYTDKPLAALSRDDLPVEETETHF